MSSTDAFWISRADLGALHEQREALKLALALSERDNQTLRDALAAYEQATQQVLRASPNHWHRFRDPFELSPAIRAARRLGRAALASLSGPQPADTAHRREAHG